MAREREKERVREEKQKRKAEEKSRVNLISPEVGAPFFTYKGGDAMLCYAWAKNPLSPPPPS